MLLSNLRPSQCTAMIVSQRTIHILGRTTLQIQVPEALKCREIEGAARPGPTSFNTEPPCHFRTLRRPGKERRSGKKVAFAGSGTERICTMSGSLQTKDLPCYVKPLRRTGRPTFFTAALFHTRSSKSLEHRAQRRPLARIQTNQPSACWAKN